MLSGSTTTIQVTKVVRSSPASTTRTSTGIDARLVDRNCTLRARPTQAERDAEVAPSVHSQGRQRIRESRSDPRELLAAHGAVELAPRRDRAVHGDLDRGVVGRRDRGVVEVQAQHLHALRRDPRRLGDEADPGRLRVVRDGGGCARAAVGRRGRRHVRLGSERSRRSWRRQAPRTRTAPAPRRHRLRPSTHKPTGSRRNPARS